jgi:hypothetical protein
MTVENIIKGLQIIEKSRPAKESPHHFRAEHDEIFAGSLDWKMSKEDKQSLKELGWSRDKDADGWRTLV